MKKQKLKNLPVQPQPSVIESQLAKITKIILNRYKVEKIICFGSEIITVLKESCFIVLGNGSVPLTKSNSYCLLVIPSKNETCHDIKMQQCLEELLRSEASVTILVHRMEEFNEALNKGSSFFTSIYRKGIILHDSNEEQFDSPAEGTPINKRTIRKEKDWNQWHHLSLDFIKGSKFFIDEGRNSLAVFMLHQALQHCYFAMIKLLTGYRANSNSLRRLLNLINIALPDSSLVAPNKTTPEDLRVTGLLLKGFSHARYDDKLIATESDVMTLLKKVIAIVENANTICSERIADLKDGKTAYGN
ncbi:HEPN domain-containing protein [Pedobacter terrae]|uniref:HEPN domain-containing protein n=1 Tax=Pedobacter terrae TaxID=405671 RepID=A0A1G7QC02_9SPHI|nr:HEPN domain-containing protein [Pedobacter terrae]SDF95965.1 HEPN domain-containing protein [Pedobacter terrae]